MIDDASKSLYEQLKHYSWLNCIGIGETDGKPCLYIYVNNLRKMKFDFNKTEWENYPIKIIKMGKIKPLC